MSATVKGCCPACGQALLYVDAGGLLLCANLKCPQPNAAHLILADSESEHIVQFDEAGFTIRHPLRERLGDALMQCDLHRYCASLLGPPNTPGRYRAIAQDGGCLFQQLDEQGAADA